MRLATVTDPATGAPVAAEIRGEEVILYPPAVSVIDSPAVTVAALLSSDAPIPPAKGARHPLSAVTLHAPIPRPSVILGIGLNYADHARETGKQLPDAPMVFAKLPGSSAPPHGELTVPAVVADALDYEVELALVMGAGGRIAGYAVANDISARRLQDTEPRWVRAKGFDNSCPWGPWVTTAEEIADPRALTITCTVDGELRQDGSTSDLVFGPDELIAYISEAVTLQPGDLILTGTPAGVGRAMDPPRMLADGSVVRSEIEQLGAIESTIRVAPPRAGSAG